MIQIGRPSKKMEREKMLKTVKKFKYKVFPLFNLNFLFRYNFRAKRQQAHFKLNRLLQVHLFEFAIRDKTFNCAI